LLVKEVIQNPVAVESERRSEKWGNGLL